MLGFLKNIADLPLMDVKQQSTNQTFLCWRCKQWL